MSDILWACLAILKGAYIESIIVLAEEFELSGEIANGASSDTEENGSGW
jgi:hypothetical protein